MDNNRGGMVAIVQSLQNAGLSVTLLGRNKSGAQGSMKTPGNVATHTATPNISNVNIPDRIPAKKPNFTPITTMKTAPTPAPVANSSSQITDGRYASSYQVAHCNVTPSCPVEDVTEFPPQRPDPYRGIFTSRPSHHTSLFANSLRKYPDMNRTKSMELIQNLLSFAQEKHSSKSSHKKGHRMKRKSQDVDNSAKSSKRVQTYTRACQLVNSKENNNCNDFEIRLNIGNKPTSYSSESPVTDDEGKSSKNRRDGLLRESYNYLNASPRRQDVTREQEESIHVSRRRDVRYLTDVTKCLKDTLREIVNNDQSVCPNISSRYSRHRMKHHKHVCPRIASGTTNLEIRESQPTVSSGGPHRRTPPKFCCHCKKPLPQCFCDKSISTYFPKTRDQESDCDCKSTSLNKKSTITRSGPGSITCYCPKKTTKEDHGKIIDEGISAWVKELPIYAKESPEAKAKREKMIEDLVDDLKQLTVKGNSQAIKNKIKKCLKALPMWKPDSGKDREVFIDQIADNLMKKLNVADISADPFEKVITDWFDSVPLKSEDSLGQLVDKGKIKEKFMNDLKDLAFNRPADNSEYKQILNQEIEHLITNLPIEDSRQAKEVLKELTNKLVEEIIDIPIEAIPQKPRLSVELEKEFQKQILDLIKDIPELSTENYVDAMEIEKTVEDVAKQLRDVQLDSADEKNIEKKINEKLTNWFDDLLEKRGIRLDPGTHNTFLDTLNKKLKGVTKAITKSRGGTLHSDNEQKTDLKTEKILADELINNLKDIPKEAKTQVIWDWLKSVPEVAYAATDEMVEQLTNDFRRSVLEGDNVEDVKEQAKHLVTKWLDTVSKNTGVEIDPRNKDRLAKELVAKITAPKLIKRPNIQENKLQESIVENISDIIDNIPIPLSEKKKVKDKIANILSKNINTDNEEKVKVEIRKVLKDANIHDDKAELIASTCIKRIKDKDSLQISREPSNRSEEVKDLVRKEVNDVFIETLLEHDDTLKEDLIDVLTDQIVRGKDPEQTRDHLFSILRNANLPEDEIEGMVTKLIGRAEDITTSMNVNDTSLKTFAFSEDADEEIFDFVEKITGDKSPQLREKRKKASKELASQLKNIMRDPEKSPLEKEEGVKNKINSFLQELQIDENLRDAYTNQLMNRLKSVAKTSTPREKRKGRKVDRPSVSHTYLDISESPSPEETMYKSELSNTIREWVTDLPIDLNSKEGKEFKESLIADLTSDIIDRQKYLQLNPKAKTSDAEELEHLKYQIFRWLNKRFDEDVLDSAMTRTENLMNSLKGIRVPSLIKHDKRHEIAQAMSNVPETSDESQRKEISAFLEELPPNIFMSNDINDRNQMINDLSRRLQTTDDVDSEISEWLRKVIKPRSSREVMEMTEGLKNRLLQKNLIFSQTADSILDQNTSQFIEDNLTKGITEWLTNLPMYQKRNSQEKRKIGELISDVAKGMKSVFEKAAINPNINQDEIFVEEIINHLKKFPLDPSQKTDEYLRQTATDLLEHLKKKNMFQDISDRCNKLNQKNNELMSRVDDWINTLPIIPRRTSKEINEFNRLKEQLKSNIKQLKRQYGSTHEFEKRFLEETSKFLELFSIDRSLVNPITVSSDADSERIKKAVDAFYGNIEKWCDELPITGNTPKEIETAKALKQSLASKLLYKIGELNVNPDVFNDDILYVDLLYDEVDALLSNVPFDPEAKAKLPVLKKELMDTIKTAKKKIQDELAAQAYKQQLRDTISKTLPIPCNISSDKLASFELLKENLADAFINLHYAIDDDELKSKYKRRIQDEIIRFCDDYLRRCPAAPLNTCQLHQDLYNALLRVPVPNDDAMKYEIEQARIKDEINDWLQKLPLKKLTSPEQLQRSKMASLLAKRLHDIEIEKKQNLDVDYSDVMKEEIKKFLKKYVTPGEESGHDEMALKLIDKLKSTENSRYFDSSPRVDAAEVSCLYRKYVMKKNVCDGSCRSLTTTTLPTSTLCPEDKNHLCRIRERASLCKKTSICDKKPTCRDACISVQTTDVSSQTEVGSSPITNHHRPKFRIDSGAQTSHRHCVSSQVPCASQTRTSPCPQSSPKIIVKEYVWDSTDSSMELIGLSSRPEITCTANDNHCSPGQSLNTCPPCTPTPCPNRLQSCHQQMPPCPSVNQFPKCPGARTRSIKKERFRPPCFSSAREDNPNLSSIRRAVPSQQIRPCQKNCRKARNRRVKDTSEVCMSSMHNEDVWEPCAMSIPHDCGGNFGKQSRDYCRCNQHGVITSKHCQNSREFVRSCAACRGNPLRNCPKCRGNYCPHPTYMYFRP